MIQFSQFDEASTYVNYLLISASSDAKTFNSQLLETQKCLEYMKSKIDQLDLQLTHIMCDRDNLRTDINILHKQ